MVVWLILFIEVTLFYTSKFCGGSRSRTHSPRRMPLISSQARYRSGTPPKLKVSYICHRAINSKANRLHIRCRITSTSFQSITTFIYLEVQILTAFLFHSIHLVALPITMTSITCLPLQGLSTVNSVCPLSSQDSSSLNSNSPSETLYFKK